VKIAKRITKTKTPGIKEMKAEGWQPAWQPNQDRHERSKGWLDWFDPVINKEVIIVFSRMHYKMFNLGIQYAYSCYR